MEKAANVGVVGMQHADKAEGQRGNAQQSQGRGKMLKGKGEKSKQMREGWDKVVPRGR